jgi:hypothetical protein
VPHQIVRLLVDHRKLPDQSLPKSVSMVTYTFLKYDTIRNRSTM